MGSPGFAIPALDRLAADHDIIAVYTQPPRRSGRGMRETPQPLAAHAAALGLELRHPRSLKTDEDAAASTQSAAAALAHGRAAPEPALLAAAVALSTTAVLLLLVPKINALRDRQLAGDDAAGRAFDRAHRLSVGINFVQIGALILAVAR